MTGDYRVAPRTVLEHVEVEGAVANESVDLDERTRIEQLLDPLARGELAALVLLALGLGARMTGLLAQLLELRDLLFESFRRLLTHRARNSSGAVGAAAVMARRAKNAAPNSGRSR
ncbi:hypothetical protein HRbin41_00375 [bacterium HR41]|nr:hypothetical protein HRbin41_00375 [bacterium HR41]